MVPAIPGASVAGVCILTAPTWTSFEWCYSKPRGYRGTRGPIAPCREGPFGSVPLKAARQKGMPSGLGGLRARAGRTGAALSDSGIG
jgi:hypothetical protein